MIVTARHAFNSPEDHDPLADIALRLREALNFIDLRMSRSAGGTRSLAVATANTDFTQAIVFPASRFSAPPAVTISTEHGGLANAGIVSVQAGSVTAAGFTIIYRRPIATAFDCNWTAIQP